MTQPRNTPLVPTTNAGTIAATGTFQTALSANGLRQAAIIVNRGAGTMEIALTTAASAVALAGLTLAAGGTASLNFGTTNGIYTGEVAISGTSPQAFAAIEFV